MTGATPSAPDHNSRGIALRAQGQLDAAVAEFRQAVAQQPNSADALANLGHALAATGRFADAIAPLRQAAALQPQSAQTQSNLGVALVAAGQPQEAIAAYRAALALTDDPAIHFNLGFALLLCGELREGWPQYEWRRRSPQLRPPPRTFAQPQWDGTPLAGRRILLHAEQGFGDTIQFARYVPLVAQRGGNIILQVQPDLVNLMQSFEGATQVSATTDQIADFDLHCPLLSLPMLFETTLQTIPAKIPYIHPSPAIAQSWQSRITADPAASRARIKVGLCWAGRASHPDDRNRSIALSAFAPLAEISDICFCSLQKSQPADQTRAAPFALTDWTADAKDFADLAGLIANLDLVISVDTAVAHLAGAMGKPTWILLPFSPDWRWLLDRADSPWYPTARLFRQTRIGDWQTPLVSVATALRSFNK